MARLTDREWQLFETIHCRHRSPAGRPADARRMLEGMLYIASSEESWSALPERFGKPDSLRRTFARWSSTGLIDALVTAATPTDGGLKDARSVSVEERYRMLAAKSYPDAHTLHAKLIGLIKLQERRLNRKKGSKIR